MARDRVDDARVVRLQALGGGGDLGGGLYDLALSLGAPMALRDLGVSRDDLGRIGDMAVKNPYANPREVTRDGILALLEAAWAGTRPKPI